MVKVELAGTSLEGASLATVDEAHTAENGWMYCDVSDGCFRGAGGTHNLSEILGYSAHGLRARQSVN
jgi:Immunity protein 53